MTKLVTSTAPVTPVGVGIIGYGAIGATAACSLANGKVDSAFLTGVCTRRTLSNLPAPQLSIEELINASEIIVEAAGHKAVYDHGRLILESGRDLILLSLGALADQTLAEQLANSGPGRMIVCSGALGGLDLLAALNRSGGLHGVRLTTSKRPEVLIQPWMEEELRERLLKGIDRILVFEGTAREAAGRFPRSINVAAALALTIKSWENVEVRIVADPESAKTSHLVEASCDLGEYRFDITNKPSPANPATSLVVSYALLQVVAEQTSARAFWKLSQTNSTTTKTN